MNKEEILKQIKQSLQEPATGRNSMGCSEAYYNAYYLIGDCFTEEELNNMTEQELNNLIKLAEYAGNAFY